jgi:hypothetical protein
MDAQARHSPHRTARCCREPDLQRNPVRGAIYESLVLNHRPCGCDSRIRTRSGLSTSAALSRYEEDSLRRPQRPGAGNAPKRAFGTPRRFTLQNRQVPPTPQPAQTCKASTFALPDTLLERPLMCNRKSGFSCAEPVEDGNSLWKEMEKSQKTRATDPQLLRREFTRINADHAMLPLTFSGVPF